MVKNQIAIEYFKNPLGELLLGTIENKLCLCDWRYRKKRPQIDVRIQSGLNAEYLEQSSPLLKEVKSQILRYCDGENFDFTIPLLMVGSDFQKRVWQALLEIPYGNTISYLGLAGKLGDRNALRAVATANGANALSLFIPCHRVIGSNNQMVGYAGGVSTKQRLLKLEKALLGNQMQMF